MSLSNLVAGVLVVLGAGVAAYLFFFSSPAVTNYPPGEGPIVAFGDSLVYGTGSTKEKDFVSLLSQQLGEPIENLGVPGDTTADGLERLGEVLERKPRIVLLLVGGNDYLRRTPPTETFANLSSLIDQLHEEGAVVVLLGVRGGVLRDNFSDSFEQLAKEKNTAYVSDVLSGLLGNESLMADQIHPNDAGYARIAERVYEVIQPLAR